MWFLTLGMCRSGVCVWVFPSTSRWGVYQRKSCRTKKIRRENTFLVWNEVNSAKLGLKTSIQISDPYVLIKSCLLNERPMFSDSEMPTASVQQYTFLFNQFCWNLKIQFKYQMFFFFLGSLQIIDIYSLPFWVCFPLYFPFSLLWALSTGKWRILPSSLAVYFPLLISLRGWRGHWRETQTVSWSTDLDTLLRQNTVNYDGLM